MIKLLIADDIEPIRKNYEQSLSVYKEIKPIITASSGAEALEMSLKEKPDVILMDIEMEKRYSGIEASRKIIKALPEAKIIMLTVNDDSEVIFLSYSAGVVDYVLKTESPAVIYKAIIDAYNNDSSVRPIIAKKLRDELRRAESTDDMPSLLLALSQLTPSEIEIIIHFYHGKSRMEICRERYVTLSTLKTQIRSILQKFHKDKMVQVICALEQMHFFDALNDSVL